MKEKSFASLPVVLVDDEESVLHATAAVLHSAGVANIEMVQDGRRLLPSLERQPASAVLLDLFMPHIMGTKLLPDIVHLYPEVPVIVMTAAQDVETAVRSMKEGAFDYLVKPVAINELEARIRAITRRAMGAPDVLLQIGKLNLDLGGRRAWSGDTTFDLTAREWAALEYLAVRANRVVSKEQIMQALYDWDSEITPNAVEKFISRLRAKLEPSGLEIRTVRGLGYYLVRQDGAPTA